MTRSNQEEQIDNDLAQMDVKAHIMHLKRPNEERYKVVTVATLHFAPYYNLDGALCHHLEARTTKKQDTGALIIYRFGKCNIGVALCHHLDNFSRKRGRIIAKGRLLKLLKGSKP